jgi:hypothetical protein
MKKSFLFACLAVLLISCKKNNGAPVDPVSEHYPQSWVFTNDASSVDKYTFLEVYGNNMKRSEVLKTYSITQLAADKHCKFVLNQARTEFTHKLCVNMQADRERKRWLLAVLSTNKQEVHLLSGQGGSETEDPGGDAYKFFIHNLPKVNGVKTIAIESVDHPGYYISTGVPGLNYSPTQAVLEKASDPTKATPWQCR